jgi:hypothetical protein
MRVTRLVSVFPELRLIVSTMLRSIPSMGHVIMMLALLLYVYAVLGLYMFREDDPEHWGTLGTALLTLFQMLTLEGWEEIQAAVLDAYPWAWVYFASFVFVAVFVVVNLFIAVVINNLESAKLEQQADEDSRSPHRSAWPRSTICGNGWPTSSGCCARRRSRPRREAAPSPRSGPGRSRADPRSAGKAPGSALDASSTTSEHRPGHRRRCFAI